MVIYHGWLFVLNPRCATTSILTALDGTGDCLRVCKYGKYDPHAHPRLAKRFLGEAVSYLHSAIVVRNPHERMVSLYEHLRRVRSLSTSFHQFLRTTANNYWQHNLLRGWDYDLYLHFENIEDQIKLIDSGIKLGKLNKSPDHPPYEQYYDTSDWNHVIYREPIACQIFERR